MTTNRTELLKLAAYLHPAGRVYQNHVDPAVPGIVDRLHRYPGSVLFINNKNIINTGERRKNCGRGERDRRCGSRK